ncbi:hypothetical protein FN846DRAFT_314855 [Sphaerosporella brunnea]|uniref:Uncharacterized protein n=1 Tax=Sphaerosporella brunnea TaxID=1250544 RepID=A0A5J5EKR6_9PEZI|nr:hypothetical protein FN846DRAFT_314855 [Sphaerosporella brunnea]
MLADRPSVLCVMAPLAAGCAQHLTCSASRDQQRTAATARMGCTGVVTSGDDADARSAPGKGRARIPRPAGLHRLLTRFLFPAPAILSASPPPALRRRLAVMLLRRVLAGDAACTGAARSSALRTNAPRQPTHPDNVTGVSPSRCGAFFLGGDGRDRPRAFCASRLKSREACSRT